MPSVYLSVCINGEERAAMTIRDLLYLIRRNAKLVIVLCVVFVVAAIVWSLFTQTSYTATASFVTSGDLALAQGLANNQAASHSNSDVRVSCSSLAAAKQVTINATGSDSNLCVETANTVAEETVKQYKEANANIIATINEANYAVNNGLSIFKYVFAALVAAFFISIIIILIRNFIKDPIKPHDSIENITGLPLLAYAPSPEGGERLLANLQFRNNGRPSTVAIVPVGDAATAPITARELAGALERGDIRIKLVKGSPHARKFQVSVPEDAAIIVSCEPLSDGMGAAYITHNADAAIVCAAEWIDSRKQLMSTVQELNLAKANIAGIVIIPEEEKPKKPRSEKQT